MVEWNYFTCVREGCTLNLLFKRTVAENVTSPSWERIPSLCAFRNVYAIWTTRETTKEAPNHAVFQIKAGYWVKNPTEKAVSLIRRTELLRRKFGVIHVCGPLKNLPWSWKLSETLALTSNKESMWPIFFIIAFTVIKHVWYVVYRTYQMLECLLPQEQEPKLKSKRRKRLGL